MRLVPRNLAGVLGAALVFASAVTFTFLLLAELVTGTVNPYVGLINYLLLPIIGALGAALWGVGAWQRRRSTARGEIAGSRTGFLDLGRIRTQQHLLLVTGMVAGGLVFLMSLGGVRSVEYTESEVFCGEVCHTVMQPEYVAYQHDAHAEIACVDCHVGEGAAAFVRAKTRGMAQVWAVATGDYPRPIPAPVEDIRDPNETCASCHWSDRDIGDLPLSRRYYLTEGFDEPWSLEMAVFVGGGDLDNGYSEGAHWHMEIANRIEYVALDRQRQEIALVRFTSAEGETVEYRNLDLDFEEADLAGREPLQVDCLTCHNRPAHEFPIPVVALNAEFQNGRLDPGMPAIRWSALELLGADYESQAEGIEAIATRLPADVADEDPEWAAAHGAEIDRAVLALQQLFARSRFPTMKADWRAYPDNLGHWASAGCFRCHAGNMESAGGDVVSYDCNTCHLVKGQGRVGEDWAYDPVGLDFIHPSDGDVMEGPILCNECHDGVLGY